MRPASSAGGGAFWRRRSAVGDAAARRRRRRILRRRGGGQNRGRLQFSLTDTVTFEDKVRIAPGGPEFDYLHGDAAGSAGGTPRHNVQAQAGYFNNGLGARIGANWKSGTTSIR